MVRGRWGLLITVLALAGCSERAEKAFPARPITIVCPPAPGGVSDMLTRTLAAAAQPLFGVPVVVENKPGGANAVGLSYGAHSKPDGYTVTYVVAELAILPHLGLSRISAEDFDLLARTNYNPATVTVRADAPWRSVNDLLAAAKARPNEIRMGNSGTGSIWHLAALALQDAGEVQFKHVPYGGAAPAVQALLGGHVDGVCVSPTEVQAQVEVGKLRMLAVMARERDPLFPQVPTLRESGYEVDRGAWGGLAVPKDTPEPIQQKLLATFRKAFRQPEFVRRTEERGIRLAWLEGEAFTEFIREQSQLNGRLISEMGLNLTVGDVGHNLFPNLLIGLILLLGGLLFLQARFRSTGVPKYQSAEVPELDSGTMALWYSGTLAGLTLVYVIALGWVGFLWATAPFLFLAVLSLRRGSWIPAILASAIGTGLVWLVFVQLLQVPLP